MSAAEQLEDPWDDTLPDDVLCWSPEPVVPEDSPLFSVQVRSTGSALPALRPSQFTEQAFWMPRTEKFTSDDGREGLERVIMDRFTFEGRRHMIRPYDTPAKKLLLFCGRQVEKSTLLGNIMLSYMCLVSGYRALYVSPSMTQTKTFSADRVREPMETSPILQRFTTSMLSQNLLEKQFINRSKLTMRYAFLNADRTRGIPAYLLAIDEFQDILLDNVPVMEQCLSHAPQSFKRQIYSGTPKSLDNNLEYFRANLSTQGEWVVPCEACNHWNILGEKNIGKNFLQCEKAGCNRQIYPMHPKAQWANMVREAPWESYRIPQLMVPWLDWKKDIIYNYENYPREKFYNEVLGLSYDSGLRPLTMQQLKDVCLDNVSMRNLEDYRILSRTQHVYAGLDWGTGEHSYTVLTLGTYVGMKFRIFYSHRFTGEDVDPEIQLPRIIEMLRYFNVRFIGSDYGGGFHSNYKLIKEFGALKVKRFQYLARGAQKVQWNPKLKRFTVARTEVMSDIFNAIKRGKLEFPRWQEWKEPAGQDMLNIYSEMNKRLGMIQYSHGLDKPDDTFHTVLYCMLASMFDYPRPDIMSADSEDANGWRKDQWPGAIDQG
jgi:hypothetical protein